MNHKKHEIQPSPPHALVGETYCCRRVHEKIVNVVKSHLLSLKHQGLEQYKALGLVVTVSNVLDG